MPALLVGLTLVACGLGISAAGPAIGRRIRSGRDFVIVDGILKAIRPRPVTLVNTVGGIGTAAGQVVLWLSLGKPDTVWLTGLFYVGLAMWTTLSFLTLAIGVAQLLHPSAVIIGSDGVELRGHIRHQFVRWDDIEADDEALYDAGLRGIPTTQPIRKRGQLVWARGLNIDVRTICAAIAYYRVDPSRRSELEPVNGYGELYKVS
jgi:hypothetical protein